MTCARPSLNAETSNWTACRRSALLSKNMFCAREHRVLQTGRRLLGEEHAGKAVNHGLQRSSGCIGDHGTASGHGFHWDQAEVLFAGNDESLAGRHEIAELLPRDEP